jgi:hypothetical protein
VRNSLDIYHNQQFPALVMTESAPLYGERLMANMSQLAVSKLHSAPLSSSHHAAAAPGQIRRFCKFYKSAHSAAKKH